MNVNKEPQDLHAINDAWKAPVSPEHDPSLVELADFGLTDEELDGIKGGTRPGSDDGGGGRTGGDWMINHNETIDADDADELELDDLIAVADDAQVKGGGWGASSYQYAFSGTYANAAGQSAPPPERPTGGGGFINNHNETTVSDDDKEAEAATLDDLPVAEEQADLTKGGMLSSGRVRVSSSSGC